MPNNYKENYGISHRIECRPVFLFFLFCFCFIPLIHVLACCESLAGQQSPAIKEREFKSPTLVVMQQQMCSWVLTHFQPITMSEDHQAAVTFHLKNVFKFQPRGSLRLKRWNSDNVSKASLWKPVSHEANLPCSWTFVLLVTRTVFSFRLRLFSGWKGRCWSRWHRRGCWWNWSKRKRRTLRASRTNRGQGECLSW